MLEGVTSPKQSRSRESFAKVKAATVALLTDPDTVDFKLADVSRVAGVSIGSIYTRVQSKADLLRAVQAEEYDRVDNEARRLSDGARTAVSFADAVRRIVRGHVELLVANATILRAFMRLAGGDPELIARGMASNDVAAATFIGALLEAGDRWERPISELQAVWCYELTFSVAGRQLGFGLTVGGMPRDPIPADQIASYLADTVLAYISASALDSSDQDQDQEQEQSATSPR